MEKTTVIVYFGVIIGAMLFLGFFGLSYFGYNVIGIQFLGKFIAMLGLIIFFISGFFLLSLKAPKS